MLLIKKYFFISIMVLLSSIIFLFLAAPLLGMILSNDITILIETLKQKDVLESVYLTIKVSIWAVLFALFTGLPLAYIIARYNFFGRSVVEAFIDIPIMIPHTAAGVALIMFFGEGIVFDIFKKIGITFVDTQMGIMIAMMFLSSTFLINGAKEGFKKVDVRLEKVARTLGANSFEVFFRISIPNAKKDIINGALMMWGRGLGEFGAVIILAYHPMVTPVLIYERFSSYGLLYSVPVASIMIVISIFIFLVIRLINNRSNNK